MLGYEQELYLFDDERSYQYLKKLGCPSVEDRWAAAANVIFAGEKWEPTRDAGEDALIYPVFSYNWQIIDLVAWKPKNPKKWYLRKGGDCMLGEDHFNMARCWRDSEVLKVFDTPIDWLLAGGKGCCPLTDDALLRFIDMRHDVRRPLRVDCSDEFTARLAAARDDAYPMPKRVKPEKS